MSLFNSINEYRRAHGLAALPDQEKVRIIEQYDAPALPGKTETRRINGQISRTLSHRVDRGEESRKSKGSSNGK